MMQWWADYLDKLKAGDSNKGVIKRSSALRRSAAEVVETPDEAA